MGSLKQPIPAAAKFRKRLTELEAVAIAIHLQKSHGLIASRIIQLRSKKGF
jgi:hypothetical protein